MPTSTTVKGLNINELTEAQYDAAVQGGVIGPNELSIITDMDNGGDFVPQVSVLPTASASDVGNIVQYVGATTEDYTNGYFYKCVASDSGVGSGEIDVNYWYPDQFTPPVTGSVAVDVFSQYLEQNNLAPISDGRIEITFQPGSNNIIFAYNVDTNWTRVDIPWTTVTTQAAEDIFANMGFDFDFSGIPTNRETATGGHMPSATVYLWESQPVMNSIGAYNDYSELPEPTAENVGTIYIVSSYDFNTGTPSNPVIYMSVPYIISFIDGEAEVTGWDLAPQTQPTNVMIDWATLESFLNSQETGFDGTNDSINISLNGENFLEVTYNADFSASAGVQTDGTVANVQQELENMGITVDLTGYTRFNFIYLKLPTEKGYEHREVPAFVPTSGTEETDYVLKADGNGGAYWAAETGGGLPDQTGQGGKFLTTDGTDASWSDKPLVNNATGSQSIGIGQYQYQTSGSNSIAIGDHSGASGDRSVALGASARGDTNYTVSVGPYANIHYGTVQSKAYSTAVGASAMSKGLYSVSLGCTAITEATGGIQIGYGTNSEAGTLSIGLITATSPWTSTNYKLLDSDGTIPEARLADTTNAQQGDVLTLDANGDAVWQAGGGGGLPSQTGHSGEFLTTDGTGASWSAISALQNTATQSSSLGIGTTNPVTTYHSVVIGTNATNISGSNIAIGEYAKAAGISAISICPQDSGYTAKDNSIIIGGTLNPQKYQVRVGSTRGSTYEPGYGSIVLGTYQFDNTSNAGDGEVWMCPHTKSGIYDSPHAYKLMDADGTIPTARLTKVNSTITLTAAGWSNGSQTITVSGVTSSSIVWVSPDPTDQSAYVSAGILCTAQGTDSLTFTATTTPSADIDVVVVAM